jgi:hypothetical protein
MPRRPSLPKDASQRAKAILDMATGGVARPDENPKTKQAAKAGRKGARSNLHALFSAIRKTVFVGPEGLPKDICYLPSEQLASLLNLRGEILIIKSPRHKIIRIVSILACRCLPLFPSAQDL